MRNGFRELGKLVQLRAFAVWLWEKFSEKVIRENWLEMFAKRKLMYYHRNCDEFSWFSKKIIFLRKSKNYQNQTFQYHVFSLLDIWPLVFQLTYLMNFRLSCTFLSSNLRQISSILSILSQVSNNLYLLQTSLSHLSLNVINFNDKNSSN